VPLGGLGRRVSADATVLGRLALIPGWSMISLDADTLVTLLDDELQFFLSQVDTKRQVILVGRLLQWLEREPRLSALLDDARQEETEAALAFRHQRRAIQAELARLWTAHSPVLKERFAADQDRGMLEVYGSVDGYETRCAAEPELIETSDCPQTDNTRTRKLIDCLRHWNNWTSGKSPEGEPGPNPIAELAAALETIDQRQKHAFRRFQAACRYLPGTAFSRLLSCRQRVELEPPPSDLSEEELGAWWGSHLDDVHFSDAVHSATAKAFRKVDGADAVEAAARQAQQDVQLVCHTLRQRLLLGWSRRAIVRRYAARCQAFESERLRMVADSSHQPELELTRDFARYLFDQGLTPLLEASIGRLRPDLIDVGHRTMFYVEAKQYKESSPRTKLVKAYRQVWSTWSRLRQEYHCPEAFLVVFRRSGPLANLPTQVRCDNLVLHSVLVDLSDEAGSSESKNPIQLSEAELQPTQEINEAAELGH
jgi:hypothetical protein